MDKKKKVTRRKKDDCPGSKDSATQARHWKGGDSIASTEVMRFEREKVRPSKGWIAGVVTQLDGLNIIGIHPR